MTTQPDLPDGVAAEAPYVRLAAVGDIRPDLDFEAFVRRYEGRLRRLVLRRLGDPSESEEITQETLLRAYQHRGAFATEDELMAWSTVVAQRLVIDRVRVRGRSVAVAEVPENSRLGRDTADIVVARHEARAALEALEAIPTRQAAILWAREVEGLHYDDIATRFGITEPAVRSLLHRGRKALRKEFKDRTGTIPLGGLVPFAPWLLALKAAGKVRDAAKTTVSNPVSYVGALALVGVTVLAIAPWQAAPPRVAPALDRVPRSSTAIDAAATGADALLGSRGDRTGAIPGGPGARDTGRDGKPIQVQVQGRFCPEDFVDFEGQCVSVSKHRRPDNITIWIGPTLPENPTGIRRIGVGVGAKDTILEDCTHVPTTVVTDCTTPDDDGGRRDDDGSTAQPPSDALTQPGASR